MSPIHEGGNIMTDYGWDLPPGCTEEMLDDAWGDGLTRKQRNAETELDWTNDNNNAMRDQQEDERGEL